MADTPSDRFLLSDQARFRRVLDQGVVVVQSAAEALVLDEVAVSVLELLQRPRSLGELIEGLLGCYEVDRGNLEADIPPFVAELVEAGVVQRLPGARP